MNQDSQSWLAAIVNSSDDAIIGKTLAGIITSWNPGAEKIFGYAAAEAIGQPIRLLFPPDRADEEKELLARIGRGERIDHFETVRVCKDGRRIHVSATLSPVTDAGGKIIGASKIARDITRHKLQAQEISRMSRLYSALSQVNQSIVRSRSREELFANICRVMIEFGRFELAWVGQLNPETKEVNVVAQHGAASAVGYVKNIRVYANDRPEGSGPAGVSIRDGRAYVCNDFGNDPAMAPWHELAVRHGLAACVSVPILLAGKVCGALLVYAAEKDFFGDKEVALMVEAALDISFALDHFAMEQQRREAEAALRENEARFRAIFNHHALGTAIIESDATISMVNDAYCRVSGYTREEVIGKSWHRTVMPEDLERLAEYSRRRQANPE
ncbi:MAG TPA: PAS domain S-box protein, partial [Candidatus Acidoferrales bacterium]|nr:PAS domain S-box protein [Candidatus Acidoferrales bacterium]